VKPPPFDYHAPESLEEALALRARTAGEGTVLAGGQSLLPILNLRLAAPAALVDIGGVAELRGIAADGDVLRVGAGTRQRAAERSEDVGAGCRLLHAALPWIGHRAIRNRGTIGGSIAHADPAAELPAVALALDAELVLASEQRRRTVAARDFFHGFMQTAIEPDELLVEVRFPADPPRSGAAFLEVARRHGDFALAGVAARVQLGPGGTVAEARLALAGVDGVPVRALEAERLVRGEEPGEELAAEAGERAAAALEPPSDLHAPASYRRRLAAVLVRRALAAAAESAG
jgi:carbon-monoxide dehydrogenase medium subunit